MEVFISLSSYLRRFARSYDKYFQRYRKLAICSHKWSCHFTPHHKCMRVLVSFSTSLPTHYITNPFNFSHSIGVKRYFIMILICTSLMTSDVEYLFTWLLPICILSFIEFIYLFFKIELIVLLLSCKNSLHVVVQVLCQLYMLWILLFSM